MLSIAVSIIEGQPAWTLADIGVGVKQGQVPVQLGNLQPGDLRQPR